jgi:inhibitor of KinA sporulation pathway (predicted exonuclease)
MDMGDSFRSIHYKFRFTFTEQDKAFEYEKELPKFKAISRNLVRKLLDTYRITKLTGGVETLNRAGDRTWCHLHLHFDAVENKETIARLIKRYLADNYSQNVTGVKYFCLKPDVAKNIDEFMRYPLKQTFDKSLCYGYTDEELEIMHKVAQASYIKCQEINQAKLDKSDNSDTLFERLCTYLKSTSNATKTLLLISATKFYVEENKPINRQTILGYVDNYMLREKIITYEDYWKSY